MTTMKGPVQRTEVQVFMDGCNSIAEQFDDEKFGSQIADTAVTVRSDERCQYHFGPF